MEIYQIEHLSFTYPNQTTPALYDLSLTIHPGEFVTLCGKSGCGKSTLLRQLKTVMAPYGTLSGQIRFGGIPLSEVDQKTQSTKIGFVLQNPEHQIVTDKVWHELAFGLESLGYSTPEIRARVAEMASFFGIQTWFHKKVTDLSGGQKQLLNLASVMAMQPSVLLLDEPTSQLDPIAAQDFLETLQKINRELGTTILLTEHRLEEALPLSDRVLVMDGGRVVADGTPKEVGRALKDMDHEMFTAFPAPMRIYAAVPNQLDCPVTVRDGRRWLAAFSENRPLDPTVIPVPETYSPSKQPLICLKDVWFRYEKDLPDVVKGLSLQIEAGEFYAIVGGNGTGKTTTLSLISGLFTPYRGQVLLAGQPLSKTADLYRGQLGVLPQDPQALFVKKTVELDLYEMLPGSRETKAEKAARIRRVTELCDLAGLLDRHPYDLSGGEQQRAALAKVLLQDPKILLLDEPTKGLDASFKETLADLLNRLRASGVTIVMVSHDIEFCARYADRCALFFDGRIVSSGSPREFFAGKSFYTTSVNRMARFLLPTAVLAQDVILACGGAILAKEKPLPSGDAGTGPIGGEGFPAAAESSSLPNTAAPANGQPSSALSSTTRGKKLSPRRILWGSLFGVFAALLALIGYRFLDGWPRYLAQFAAILSLAFCLLILLPQKQLDVPKPAPPSPGEKKKLPKRTLVAAVMILLAIPLTIFIGIYFLNDRKYYIISLLILLETFLPFFMVFERRRPQARELVVISVLCAIAVVGRTAFYMLPQFSPVLALVIIAGVCFGGESGFLVGAVTAFLSNFFFGQGPWTPWQMFAFGVIGFLAGVLYSKRCLRKTRGSLMLFGGLAAFILYGGIMNPSSVLMYQPQPNLQMFLTAYSVGIPFDLVHGVATAFFLWLSAGPMIEKLDRIKLKYGLIER